MTKIVLEVKEDNLVQIKDNLVQMKDNLVQMMVNLNLVPVGRVAKVGLVVGGGTVFLRLAKMRRRRLKKKRRKFLLKNVLVK